MRVLVLSCCALTTVHALAPVLSVIDAKTKTHVVLVGTQHFNPASIALAEQVVQEQAASGSLRAVALESCPRRWNATLRAQPSGSILRVALDNEMQAAAEAGEAFGAETTLVDQPIDKTSQRLQQLLTLTAVELATPWSGGWQRIADDIRQGSAQVLSAGGLRASAIVDPRLLLGAPLSLLRYVFSAWVESPLLGVALLASVAFYWMGPSPAVSEDGTALATTGIFVDLWAFAAFQLLQWVVYARVILVGLLEERNYIIARNIRATCLKQPGGTVVGVLGMAHLNGVRSLLSESRIV